MYKDQDRLAVNSTQGALMKSRGSEQNRINWPQPFNHSLTKFFVDHQVDIILCSANFFVIQIIRIKSKNKKRYFRRLKTENDLFSSYLLSS